MKGIERVIEQLERLDSKLHLLDRIRFRIIKDDLLECLEEVYTPIKNFLGYKNVEIIDEDLAIDIIGKLRKWLKETLD